MFNELLAQPLFGASWEGFVLEQIQSSFPSARFSYYRTTSGVEIDLVMEFKQERILIETKASTAPQAIRGFWTAVADLDPTRSVIVAPVSSGWPLRPGAWVMSLGELTAWLRGALAASSA